MAARKTVIFVCTGNVCRSPMAAGLFYDKLVREKANDRVRIRSAGIWALEGRPASAYAQQVMSEHDLDISAHRGRDLTQAGVDEADLLLVMTQRHADVIARDLKRSKGKVHLLSAMAGEPHDIEDPYGDHGLPLLPGAYVSVDLFGLPLGGLVQVPRRALYDGGTVWTVSPGDSAELRGRPVDIAFRDGEHIYVSGGLEPGETVVVSPLALPIDGTPVRVEQSADAAAAEEM